MTATVPLTATQRLLAKQPYCIYCGGTTLATTREHIPSRVIFDAKHRPKGLEFSACEPCNSATRKAETVIAMLSRVFPDRSVRSNKSEMRKLADAAFRNHPGLADEMHLDQVAGLQRLGERAKNLPTWNFLNVNGPICRGSLDQFGVKLGLSLHYEATKQIVPVGGAVLLNHYSNVDAFTGEIPPDLLGLFGEGTTLKQGRLEVSKQFRYSSLWAEDTLNISMHLAVFRESFGTLMIVAHDANHLPEGSQVEAFYI